MHHKCIKVQSFNRLDEFIHIICIENKETILIRVTSGSDTSVKFLMAINHTYIVEKLKNSPFLTQPEIHVIRSDDSMIEEYLIHARRSLSAASCVHQTLLVELKGVEGSLHPLQLSTRTSLLGN